MPTDAGNPRLLRTGMLASELHRQGHRVTWWASTFNHFTKSHRAGVDTEIQVAPGYRVKLLHSPGYSRHFSLSRFRDHRALGRRYRAAVRAEPGPDVIHCAFPTIELAYETAVYARQSTLPWVIDARDMWPDIYLNKLPSILGRPARLALRREFSMTERAFSAATAVTGHTQSFVNWGLEKGRRAQAKLDAVFPFAYSADSPGDEAISVARSRWRDMGVGLAAREFNICFFGAFPRRREVDLSTVIGAARMLAKSHPHIRWILCGVGPRLAELSAQARGLDNVLLPGWINAPEIWTLMRQSAIGLLPYLPSRDFVASIPNKAIEYLSGGLPILTSLVGGELERLARGAGCGLFYRGGDEASLADAIVRAAADPSGLAAERAAANRLFSSQFNSEFVIKRMVDHIAAVAATAVGPPEALVDG